MDEGLTPEQEAIEEAEATLFVARIKGSFRLRSFPYLGWTVILAPMDVFPGRTSAKMTWGTMYGFEPEDIVELRPRMLTADEGGPERTWWAWATRTEKLEERRLGVRPPD